MKYLNKKELNSRILFIINTNWYAYLFFERNRCNCYFATKKKTLRFFLMKTLLSVKIAVAVQEK